MKTLTVTADELAEIRLKERQKVGNEIVDLLGVNAIDPAIVAQVAALAGLPSDYTPPTLEQFEEWLDAAPEVAADSVGPMVEDHGLPRDGPSVEGDDEWADALQRTGISPS